MGPDIATGRWVFKEPEGARREVGNEEREVELRTCHLLLLHHIPALPAHFLFSLTELCRVGSDGWRAQS